MKPVPKAAARTVYTQQLSGIDRDIARCGVLHARVLELLATVKKDSVYRA